MNACEVYGGDAMARIEAVWSSSVRLPGETVEIQVKDGDMHAISSRSAVRAGACRASLPLFTRCGGCHYQHGPTNFSWRKR